MQGGLAGTDASGHDREGAAWQLQAYALYAAARLGVPVRQPVQRQALQPVQRGLPRVYCSCGTCAPEVELALRDQLLRPGLRHEFRKPVEGDAGPSEAGEQLAYAPECPDDRELANYVDEEGEIANGEGARPHLLGGGEQYHAGHE